MSDGFSFLIFSLSSGSRLSTEMEALCENNAQQSGVANVRHKPQNRTWIGELAQGNRFKTVVFFSKKLTNAGVSTMPKNAEGRFQFFIHNAKFISRSVILINSPGRPLPLLCFPFFFIFSDSPAFSLFSLDEQQHQHRVSTAE